MAKKKMTAAQAAAARRPDDWVPPQSAKPAKKKDPELHSAASVMRETGKKENRGMMIGVLVLFVAAAVIAPFIVIYASNFLGIS